MATTTKFTVTIELDENDDRDLAELTEQIDEAVSDRVDGWYSVDVELTEPILAGMHKFIAEPNYVERVYLAVEANNPNAPEDLDGESIQDLANYARANDLIELHDDGDMIDKLLDPSSPDCLAYFMYDMIKWTRANNWVTN